MANIHAGGQWGGHIRYLLLLFLPLFLLRGIRSCASSTESLVQNSSCAAVDAGTTQCHENGTSVSIPKHKWHEKPSHQCQNFLLPEIFGLQHSPFTVPNTAMDVFCIPDAKEITSEPDLASSQLQSWRSKIDAPPNENCPRCQTGPWRASLFHFPCWTMWSPRFICWDELTNLLIALCSSKLSPIYENWQAQFEQDPIVGVVRIILIVTLIVMIHIFIRKIIAPGVQSRPAETALLVHRQQQAFKQFTRAVDELFRKILSENQKRKLEISVRRVSRIRDAVKSFRKKLRRLGNRRKWTHKELPPSRFRTDADYVTGVKGKEAEATTNEAKRPWSLRWHNFNFVHMSMLPSEGSTSGVHAYVQKQRQDEEKLVNFWRQIFRKRSRKYCHRGLNRWKDTPHITQQTSTGSPGDAFQRQGRTSRSDVHSNDSEKPAFSAGVQQEAEYIKRCMYSIFYAFRKDASEWRYWQRNEQMNFLEVVMNQIERWRKLQLAFEGGILESTFKLTIISNSIVRKFQDISIYLTGEEMKGSKLVRFATTRGKGAAAAAVQAHSSTWAHLTEAALDARLVRQMNFFRTHFEEQKKFLNSATVHTRHVENSLEQVCQDHMKRLTTNLQKSFDREVEKQLSQLTHQQQQPTPATRIRKDLEDMKDTQKKLVEHCYALAGAAQEFARQHFQDQQEQLDRMATKLHMILDRHMDRDRVQEQKLQQMLDACSEKNKKQLAIALEKTNSQGSAATASLLQQQNELRRMCEAHKDQGERISHMVEGLTRQQKTQQSIAEQGQNTSLSVERNLVRAFREELQAAKKEMVEKLSQIERQNRAIQCCSNEKSSAELERMVNSVTSQLQQQRQEQRSLHETLLIQRRDTLELLKHFTNLALSPEPQQAGSSELPTTPLHFNGNVTSAIAVHPNADTFVYSKGYLSGDNNTADETAGPRHPFQSDPGFQPERRTTDSISLASAIALNTQGAKQQLQHVMKDQTREENVPLQRFPGRPPLAVQVEETACRSAVLTHTDSCPKQGSLPDTPVNCTQLGAGTHAHTEQFEQLLERWKRSVSNAERTEHDRAKLIVGSGRRFPHDVAQTRQEFNRDAQLDRNKMAGPSCSMGKRHAYGNEPFSIDSITELFCTDHLIPHDSQSVTDLTSPVHALQRGRHQAGRESVVLCSKEPLVTHSGARAVLAEEHGLALGKGRDGTQLGAARAAELQHSDRGFQSQLLQQRLQEQKQQPAIVPQYEGAATPDLQNLVLDWGND